MARYEGKNKILDTNNGPIIKKLDLKNNKKKKEIEKLLI